MIARISIGNFLSFKDVQSITFEASSLKGTTENIYHYPSADFSYKLLKSISIHGSNSSGKSNFFKAFAFMKYWVLNSFNEANKTIEIPTIPFLLRQGFDKKSSFFEIVFYINEIKYRYGFLLNKESVDEEWLFYSEPKKREQHYFIRKQQDIVYNNSWKRSLKIKLDPIIPYVKPRVLFISVLSQFNIDVGNMTIDWFNKNNLGFDFNNDYYINKTASLLTEKEYYLALHELINKAHLGFKTLEQTIVGKYKSQSLSKDFIEFIFSDDINEYKISTKHSVVNEKNKIVDNILFDLRKDESVGTQKFFALAGALLTTIKNRQILWVDELDARFHPELFETIVKFFNSNKFNHRGAQLIFTTHNTHLLKGKLLRRDQIYTFDKNEYGESLIKGAHSANIRIDASHEKEYFEGKMGGIQKLDFNSAQLNLFE